MLRYLKDAEAYEDGLVDQLAEPVLDDGLVHQTPATLGVAGRRVWALVVESLPETWQLDVKELLLLKKACDIEDLYSALSDELDAASELVVHGSKGQLRVHPAVDKMLMSIDRFRVVLGEIGLVPGDAEPASGVPQTAASRRASKAANVRHGNFGQRAAGQGRMNV